MKTFNVQITFHADSKVIESILYQLQDTGLKPTQKLIKKIFRDCTYWSGDAFITEPTLYDKFDENSKRIFTESYKNLGFK